MEKNESLFYEKLNNIFIGEKIEGNSGFVNLMRIKSAYFDIVFNQLKKEIDDKTKEFPEFKEEMYDKLNTFFQSYFSESGSIYFTYTPLKSKIYDKIYTSQDDVILFWKTRMLYYVKTDKIWHNLSIEYKKDNFTYNIYFDVSKLEHKSGNEKKEIMYELKAIEGNKISFYVIYSQNGRKTAKSEMIKKFKSNNIDLNEDDLDKIFNIFERQNEVDYFINKNAREFLKEQFDLWLKNYLFDDESDFSERRLKELKLLKEVAYKIIDFVSQFEDELAKIWNKPKFVLNSNYVITLDRIANKQGGIELIKKIMNHNAIEKQVQEWKDLGIVNNDFVVDSVIIKNQNKEILNEVYKFLPVDTKYFKDLELDILGLFYNIDDKLDGWLIHSENYQALNTILPKFKEKVQSIYIDPPFNKAESEQFLYIANYLDSTWITMLENRLTICTFLLNDAGTIFVNSDDKSDAYTRFLLDKIFRHFQNEIVWAYEKPGPGKDKFKNNHTITYFYSKNDTYKFNTIYVPRKGEDELTSRQGRFSTSYSGKISSDWWNDLWDDIPSFATSMTAGERVIKNLGVSFTTQLPEKLLYRIIKSATDYNDLILDFFLGSATTTAVAHKLHRKWIGVEMGEHFYTIALPRMKKVLAYDKSGISKENDVKYDYNEKKAGGFFKYYDLEQYEQTLRKCQYIPSEPFFNLDDRSIYEQYVFMKDPKLLDKMELDCKNNKIKINFDNIYPNIDLAETLSNLKGKWIKKITSNSVVLKDDSGNEEKIKFDDIDFKTIKPLIWW